MIKNINKTNDQVSLSFFEDSIEFPIAIADSWLLCTRRIIFRHFSSVRDAENFSQCEKSENFLVFNCLSKYQFCSIWAYCNFKFFIKKSFFLRFLENQNFKFIFHQYQNFHKNRWKNTQKWGNFLNFRVAA